MNAAAIFAFLWRLFSAIQSSPDILALFDGLFDGEGRRMATPDGFNQKLRAAFDNSPEVVTACREFHGGDPAAKAALPVASLFTLFQSLLPSLLDLIAQLRKPKPTA
jgi:hypothetical protein